MIRTPAEALEAAANAVKNLAGHNEFGPRTDFSRGKGQAFDHAVSAILAIPVAEPYPTEDAYMSACRALHWRTAQLCANHIEPVRIPDGAPQYPPDDFDFDIADRIKQAMIALHGAKQELEPRP